MDNNEDTIEVRAKRGELVFEAARRASRDAYIAGIHPRYIKLTLEEAQDVFDWLIHMEQVNPITDSGNAKICGLEIITDERTILNLKRD